jgi:hypothetical protein
MEEAPFDGVGFAEKLSETFVRTVAFEIGHHGFARYSCCYGVLWLPWFGICDTEEEFELLPLQTIPVRG